MLVYAVSYDGLRINFIIILTNACSNFSDAKTEHFSIVIGPKKRPVLHITIQLRRCYGVHNIWLYTLPDYNSKDCSSHLHSDLDYQ